MDATPDSSRRRPPLGNQAAPLNTYCFSRQRQDKWLSPGNPKNGGIITPVNPGLKEWGHRRPGFDDRVRLPGSFLAGTSDGGVMLALPFILGGIGIIYTIRKSPVAHYSSPTAWNSNGK